MSRMLPPRFVSLRRRGLPLLAMALAEGCGGVQSALDPAGPEAAKLARLTWVFIAVSACVFVLVVVYLAVALFRRRAPSSRPVVEPDARTRRKLGRSIGVATAATVLTLVALLASSAAAGHVLSRIDEPPPVSIRITGYQWWWQVQYPAADVSKTVTTANEIHVPVGRTIAFELRSQDVIHSFWVPRLTGKIDLIPSRINFTKLRVDQPGRFRGQCAEFCGYQHAHMAFFIVAEAQSDFDAWLDRQRAPAAPPSTERAERGRQVFFSNPCVMCHGIRGTDAGATFGPDLTHLATRDTLAAGILSNDGSRRIDWISHAQSLKPGSRMPSMGLTSDDLTALSDYLAGLR
jgi:cytochrome c oxidase subunit 2